MTLTLDFQGQILKMLYFRNVMVDWHGRYVERDVSFKECWTHIVTFNVHLSHDHDLGFSRSIFLIAIYRNARAHRHWTKTTRVDRVLSVPTMWPSAMILTSDFQSEILKMPYLRNGRSHSHGMKGMWVRYDVGCTMGLKFNQLTHYKTQSSNLGIHYEIILW